MHCAQLLCTEPNQLPSVLFLFLFISICVNRICDGKMRNEKKNREKKRWIILIESVSFVVDQAWYNGFIVNYGLANDEQQEFLLLVFFLFFWFLPIGNVQFVSFSCRRHNVKLFFYFLRGSEMSDGLLENHLNRRSVRKWSIQKNFNVWFLCMQLSILYRPLHIYCAHSYFAMQFEWNR